MDILTIDNILHPYTRHGGGPAYISNNLEDQVVTRRRKWYRSPIHINMTVIGDKQYIQSLYATLCSYGGDTPVLWHDYFDAPIKGEVVGTGNGSRITYYFDNKYIIASTLSVYDNGIITADYSLDSNTGKIVFNTAPSNNHVITADYGYYRKVYIDNLDVTDIVSIADNIWRMPVQLVEVVI